MAHSLVKNKPSRSALSEFFPNFDSWAVGFDREWQMLEDLQNSFLGRSSSYPPYNIKETGDNSYEIEMAVAGFNKDNLKVELKNNRLIIEGNHESKEDKSDEDYVYKGIASRQFRQSFALADHVTVSDSELKDGILKIKLKGNPPHESHKMIEIH